MAALTDKLLNGRTPFKAKGRIERLQISAAHKRTQTTNQRYEIRLIRCLSSPTSSWFIISRKRLSD